MAVAVATVVVAASAPARVISSRFVAGEISISPVFAISSCILSVPTRISVFLMDFDASLW